MKNHQCQSFTYFSKAQEENNLPNFLYEARISLIPKQNQEERVLHSNIPGEH